MEEQQGNPSEDSVPGEQDVSSSEGQENAAENAANLSLEELNKVTGRQYETVDDALRGIKETVDYVGKAGQAEKELTEVRAELDKVKTGDTKALEEKFESLQKAVDADKFYSDNPNYKPYAEIISKLGDKPAEVVESDAFKVIYEKAKVGEEAEKAKSVLETNPRLGQQADKARESRELANEGLKEDDGNKIRQAQSAAVNAVLDSLSE